MTVPVLLYGALATHRRGKVLEEAASAATAQELPEGRAVVVAFGETFQGAGEDEQARLIEWTRAAGHVFLLVPPFTAAPCCRPVPWRAERVDAAPRGGEGLAKVLASEVAYMLTGDLQTSPLPGATWSDLSVCLGTYRPHPAAGLFAVTCLPLWSLQVLDVPGAVEAWLNRLADLAGDVRSSTAPEPAALDPDHYGLLVFMLSRAFDGEEQMLVALRSSPILRFPTEHGRSLLTSLRDRGLVLGVTPTLDARALVMGSPYAPYVDALREVSQ